jgi:hypothetical protein
MRCLRAGLPILAALLLSCTAKAEPPTGQLDDPVTLRALEDRGALLRFGGDETLWEVIFNCDKRDASNNDPFGSSGSPANRLPPVNDKDLKLIKSPDLGRRTPLHLAIQNGNLFAAKSLIAHGTDIHAKTTDRQTPLSLTAWHEAYRDIAGMYQTTAELSRATDQRRRQAVDNRNAARKAICDLLPSKKN